MSSRHLPFLITCLLFLGLFIIGALQFPGFGSSRVFFNLFSDNAFLVITAVGMTFVIISGGIDLSVGAVIALSGVLSSVLIEHHGWHPLQAFSFAIISGALFGSLMGVLIHYYKIQAFIVTLAGMFFARGLATIISEQSIPINHPFYDAINNFGFMLPGGAWLGSATFVLFIILIFAIWLAHYSRFGGCVYALGGSQQSAQLMGIPIARTTILIYALSSSLAALAGIIYSLYTSSGYALAATGMELDTIAAVVIGGTLLTGGAGYVHGTLVGVLIMGLIQTYISFQGNLNSWWTKIVIGALVLVFVALQKWLAHSK